MTLHKTRYKGVFIHLSRSPILDFVQYTICSYFNVLSDADPFILLIITNTDK